MRRVFSASPVRYAFRPFLLVGLTLGLIACGGSSPAPQSTTPIAAKPAPRPPVPDDPWAVVPDDASSLLLVDVGVVRASPHAAFMREWTRSAYCLSPEQESLIFERTEQVLAAQWTRAENGVTRRRNLLVAKGSFIEQDAASAVDLATTLSGAEKLPVTPQTQGRFRVLGNAAVMAARVGETLLVLGDAPSVQEALALADGKLAKLLRDGELIARSGAREEIDSSTAILIAVPDERVAHGANRALGSVGLPKDLLSGLVVFIARMSGEGVGLEGRVLRPSAASASHAADKVRSRLGQVNLLARLAGLPGVLGNAEVQTNAKILSVKLQASHADVAVFRDRLRDLFADQPACAK